MTESPKDEALRLARKTGLSVNDYGQVYATGSGAVLLEDLVRLIALARASQAQPEQGEGKCYECGKEFGPRATFELGVAIGKKQAQPEPLAEPKTILERAYEAVKSTKPPAPPNWKQPAEPPAAPVQQEPK